MSLDRNTSFLGRSGLRLTTEESKAQNQKIVKSKVVMSVIPHCMSTCNLSVSLSDFLSFSSFIQKQTATPIKQQTPPNRSRHICGFTSWRHAKRAHASKFPMGRKLSPKESVIFLLLKLSCLKKKILKTNKSQGTYQLALAPFDMHGHTSGKNRGINTNHVTAISPRSLFKDRSDPIP